MKISLIAIALVAFATSASVAAAQDAADPAAGEKVFAKCKLCHQIGEGAKNAVGPELNGAVGRKAGSAPGYNYSTANKDSGITWDEAALKQYLKNPRAMLILRGQSLSLSVNSRVGRPNARCEVRSGSDAAIRLGNGW